VFGQNAKAFFVSSEERDGETFEKEMRYDDGNQIQDSLCN
jgi:hypothetical protein